jgi:hypothetical protein
MKIKRENINKLFYIFMIGVLLIVINNLVAEVKVQSDNMDDSINVHNKIMTTHYKLWRDSMRERDILKGKNTALEHDIESMLDELAGIKHDFLATQSENIALKKWLDSSAKNP